MENKIEKEALFKIPYGLFVLTTKDGNKDNGCIVNTVSMITETPKRITVYVNKLNYTEQLIKKTGVFNVSVLTESAPFDLFKQFGFSSGRDTDKFAGKTYKRSENGLFYITEHANAFLSAKVVDALDYGTHTLFVAEVTEAKVLSSEPSVTYDYYFAHIKPKPAATQTEAPTEKKVKRWICKICGYVYEGEYLPDDYICPLCKHGIEDFEPID
jgi:flavin reductase (DIM6/NTAB) family NADH-FMN oxidoreductase RutF/rubredoxin